MLRKPKLAEWDTSRLPDDRRSNLDMGLSFEEIVAQIAADVEIVTAWIGEYREAPPDDKGARQVVFRVRSSRVACDLLYNAPDGLRARYWQSPDHGLLATRYLIGSLSHALVSYSESNQLPVFGKVVPMKGIDVRASLVAPSAKVWPREVDADGNYFWIEQELLVSRWIENEERAPTKTLWRRTAIGARELDDQIEIKGALLRPDGFECVPSSKLERSCRIHLFGYT